MPRLRMLIVASLTASGCSAPAVPPDRFTASGEVIAMGGGDGGVGHACFSCHGLDGGGDGAATPRLAGLDPGYLQRQLDDYANGRRAHKEMAAIARRMQPDARASVSSYYGGLPATGRSTGPADGGAARLYAAGDPARDLPACASCHGARGEGVGPGNPPLAGQPAIYVAAQLDGWRAGRRYNDALGEMRRISRRLTPDEIRRLAAFVASLAPDPPAARAASPPARRGDRRNGA